MIRVRRVVFAVTLAIAIAAGLMVPAAGPGRAQGIGAPPTATGGAPSDPRIELAAQDPWTPVGGDVRFRLSVTNPPADASISFTAYQALTGRRQYDNAVLGNPLTSVLSQVSVPLDAVPADGFGTRTLTLGLQSPTGVRDPDRLNVRRAGVYPVEVDLRDGDEQTVANFRTMLVIAEADRATVAEPLQVAWVWPITTAPSYLPDGNPDRQVVSALRADGRLGRMVVALRDAPDIPVTLAPTGETLETWAEHARTDSSILFTFDALLAAAAPRTVLDGPYVPIDLPSLLDHGLDGAADDVLLRGSEALLAQFGSALDRRTRVVRPASPSAVGRLHAGGVDRVIVPSDALAPAPELRFTLAQPVTVPAPLAAGGTEPVTALVSDSGFQGVLGADLPEAQRAQLLLGGLALVALEAPATPRVVTLVNPDGFDVPTQFYDAFFAGLRDNPFLRPVTTTQAFDSVPVDPPAPTVSGTGSSERALASAGSADAAITAAAYRNQRSRLNAFGALTRPGDPAVATADRSLLASVSSGWPPDIVKVRAAAHLHVVDRVIDALVSQIEVPDPRTITLTSRSGEIPLTFRNETGFPVRLRASLASEKLFFPDGAVIELELPPKSTTVRVAVEARTSGTFPLNLEVTSIDGVLPISQRRLEVRSTFVSTVGMVLMASAVAFLALWWGLDLRRRRRRRRQPSPT